MVFIGLGMYIFFLPNIQQHCLPKSSGTVRIPVCQYFRISASRLVVTISNLFFSDIVFYRCNQSIPIDILSLNHMTIVHNIPPYFLEIPFIICFRLCPDFRNVCSSAASTKILYTFLFSPCALHDPFIIFSFI